METASHTIKTGVDKLVELVREKKRVSIEGAAQALSMQRALVEELADFLEEKEVIGIDYKLGVPYLVYKELTRDEIEDRARQFAGRKVSFVRKVDTAIQSLDQHSGALTKLKTEFEKLSKELDSRFAHVKGELDLLSRHEQMKREIDSQILEQQHKLAENKRAIEAQVMSKRDAIASLVKEISAEEEKLSKEENLAKLLKSDEEQIERRLQEAAKNTSDIRKKVRMDMSLVGEAVQKIARFKELAEKAKQEMQKGEEALDPLLEESRKHEQKITELQKQLLEKLGSEVRSENHPSRAEAAQMRAKFKALFQKKASAERMVRDLNSDMKGIKEELKAMAQEAIVVRLTSKNKNITEIVDELEGKFREVIKKKEKFQSGVSKLISTLRKF